MPHCVYYFADTSPDNNMIGIALDKQAHITAPPPKASLRRSPGGIQSRGLESANSDREKSF